MTKRKPTGETISMAPSAKLVQASLDHCKIPLNYRDDHTIEPKALGINEVGTEMKSLLEATLTLAMEKHFEDTFIMPTNVAKLGSAINTLHRMFPHASDELAEVIFSLESIAQNLDPAKRDR